MCEQTGMKLLECAMECTKKELKERIKARDLAKELVTIKNVMEHGKHI